MLRDLPRSIGVRFFLLRPSERQIYHYTRVFLAKVEPRLKGINARPELDKYASLMDTGGLLLGDPGSGKTTWLQALVAGRASMFLQRPQSTKAPILIPARSFFPGRSFFQVLHEHVSGFAPISERFMRALQKGRFARASVSIGV